MEYPRDLQHGQLFWWQARPQLQTQIVLCGTGLKATRLVDRFLVRFALFDIDGQLHASWQQPLHPQECIFIDSAMCPATRSLSLTEGILAVFLTAFDHPNREIHEVQLESEAHWYCEDGTMTTLYSQQRLAPTQVPIRWSEVVLRETEHERNGLVILNGPKWQPLNSIELEITNHQGDRRKATYTPVIMPYTLHRIELATVFPDLLEFSQGRAIALTGSFTSCGIRVRPYVTQGNSLHVTSIESISAERNSESTASSIEFPESIASRIPELVVAQR